MIVSASPRLRAYAWLTATALVAALAFGKPELAVLAAPFAVFLAFVLAPARRPGATGSLTLKRDRALEDERIAAELVVRATGATTRVDVHLPAGPALDHGTPPSALVLRDGEERRLRYELPVKRWGVHRAGPAFVRASDALGAFTVEGRLGEAVSLRAYPRPDRLRGLVAPLLTRPVLGSQVARDRGEGIEFADLRPFARGDRARSINWRATARRGEPWVNLRHPEQSADVVLFLDTFSGDETTLDAAVRATAVLARAYLQRRDRVALVSFGGELTWLTAEAGTRQLYRIVEALIASEVRPSFWWKDVTHLPRRLLPSRALVLALSPLLDPRGIDALLDLRARGYDLAVVEVSPVPPSLVDERSTAVRLWELQRDALRARFETLGVPVARWEHTQSGVDPAIEEVIAFRRHARPAARA